MDAVQVSRRSQRVPGVATDSETEIAQDLVLRIGALDNSAEALLVSRYYTAVTRYLQKRVSDRALVEDVCQDTFIAVITRLRSRSIDNPGRLKGFIIRTAHCKWVGQLRKLARRKTFPCTDTVEGAQGTDDEVLDTLAKIDARHFLLDQISRLPTQRDRDLLRSFHLEGESKVSICRRLAVKNDHFNRINSRAKKRLGQLVASSTDTYIAERSML